MFAEKEEKSKEQLQYVVIMILVGMGYYFFVYLNQKRDEMKAEINNLFQKNPTISVSELDNSL